MTKLRETHSAEEANPENRSQHRAGWHGGQRHDELSGAACTYAPGSGNRRDESEKFSSGRLCTLIGNLEQMQTQILKVLCQTRGRKYKAFRWERNIPVEVAWETGQHWTCKWCCIRVLERWGCRDIFLMFPRVTVLPTPSDKWPEVSTQQPCRICAACCMQGSAIMLN